MGSDFLLTCFSLRLHVVGRFRFARIPNIQSFFARMFRLPVCFGPGAGVHTFYVRATVVGVYVPVYVPAKPVSFISMLRTFVHDYRKYSGTWPYLTRPNTKYSVKQDFAR
jgi:hypothetical protein